MQIVIDIPEEIYNHTQRYEVGGFNRENDTKLFMAIKNGIPLPENTMILDKDKLERDTEWDDYYDGFMSYSQIALEAAEIKEQAE